MRIKQARVHDSGQVTIQWEGDDPESDFGPISDRLAQNEAAILIQLDGTTPNFFVAAMNLRREDDLTHAEYVKAQRFAIRYSLPFRDLVR